MSSILRFLLSLKYSKILFIFLILATDSTHAFSQISGMVSGIEDKKSLASFALSYGEILNKNAWFYGFSGEYSRRLNNLPIGFAGSIMWDDETRRENNIKNTKSFTLAATGSYLINQQLSIGTGIGKGIVDDDNPRKSYEFTDGDWSTGLFLGYQFVMINRSLLGISGSYEYNISAMEHSLSIDLSYGFAF